MDAPAMGSLLPEAFLLEDDLLLQEVLEILMQRWAIATCIFLSVYQCPLDSYFISLYLGMNIDGHVEFEDASKLLISAAMTSMENLDQYYLVSELF